jgi:hypothetical protein
MKHTGGKKSSKGINVGEKYKKAVWIEKKKVRLSG